MSYAPVGVCQGDALNSTGRKVLFSLCGWSSHLERSGETAAWLSMWLSTISKPWRIYSGSPGTGFNG